MNALIELWRDTSIEELQKKSTLELVHAIEMYKLKKELLNLKKDQENDCGKNH